MYQPKTGYAAQSAELPQICMVVAYMADKTYKLYNRQGDNLVPCTNCNWDKWEETKTGMESILAEKLNAKEVVVLKTNSQRSTAGAIGL